MAEKLFNLKEVAALFGAAPRTVRRWVAEGKFPEPITVAGVKRWRSIEIEQVQQEAIADRIIEKRQGAIPAKHDQTGPRAKTRS